MWGQKRLGMRLVDYIYHGDLILWFTYSLLMHGTSYNFNKFFLDLATSNCDPTIIQSSRDGPDMPYSYVIQNKNINNTERLGF